MLDGASKFDVIIVGGGVAGLSAAALLAPHRRVLLLEREPRLASHASGVNAAIHQPIEHDQESARLARRSRELLRELCGDHVLQRTGLLLVSRAKPALDALALTAHAEQLAARALDVSELSQHVPALAGGEAAHGLLLRDGGVIDLHLLISSLATRARERGAVLQTSAEVAEIERSSDGSRVIGVRTISAERFCAAHVVIAAGAWSAGLGRALGIDTPLTPLRRHLVQLRTQPATAQDQPVVWRVEDEVYFRPNSSGVLASPCDELAWPAEIPETDEAQLRALTHKLERTAPALASAHVQRAWACLRTFAPDRELVIGDDPRLIGLYWLCGLGGRGMSVATGAAEILVDQIVNVAARAKLEARYRVARLF
jgi:D-arginine dehydrogenase